MSEIWPLKHYPRRVVYIILHQILNFLLVLLQTEQPNSCTHDKLFCWLKLFHPSIIFFIALVGKNCCKHAKSIRKRKWWLWSALCKVEWLVFTGLLLWWFDSYSSHFVNVKVLFLSLSHFCALIYRHRQWKSKLNSGRRWLTSTSLETLRWELQTKLYSELWF